jgi:hypothetical protein
VPTTRTRSVKWRLRIIRNGLSRIKCFQVTGRYAAKPRDGKHLAFGEACRFSLGLIEKQPDPTLDEVVLVMRKHKIAGSRTALWRFFKRHKLLSKKAWAQRSGSARTGVGYENRACRDRRQHQDGGGRCPRGERLIGRCRRGTGSASRRSGHWGDDHYDELSMGGCWPS